MIEVQGLTKSFGGSRAIDDLSFTVRPGIVTGFLGPNGAGKSTTMRLILGLDRPDSGRALVNGKPFTDSQEPMREVGALLNAGEIHGGRSARNHLRALAASNGIPDSRVSEVLDLVGITGVASRRIKGFSLGMSQRLGIAGALLGDPRVLLFDEPVNGLDPEGIAWIRNLMRSLASDGRTVLVSSHLMAEMSQTADHVIVIGRGRLLADAPTQDFLKGAAGNRVRVRSPQMARLAELIAAHDGASVDGAGEQLDVTGMPRETIGDLAAANGITIHELYEDQASLEAAFMEMTESDVEFRAGA